MSRIGRQPIPLPSGVTVTIERELVTVKGPKGELSERISRDITVTQGDREGGDGQELVVTRPTDRGEHRALHGLTRTLVANMVTGVTQGFEKRLEIVGVGYRVTAKGKNLELALGYNHSITVEPPEGITFAVESATKLAVQGIDKQRVGEVAANIRKL